MARRTALLGPAAVLACAAGLTALALAAGPGSAGRLEEGLAAAAAVAAVGLALAVRPAWPLSIGLALGAFSGQWDTMSIPLALDRLLIATAIVSTLLREFVTRRSALRLRPVDLPLVLAALYAITSAVLAGNLDDRDLRFALLDRFSLLGFVLFFVAPRTYREARDRQILLAVLVALGAYLGLTALFETLGARALVVPGYINDPAVGTHFDRARGPFVEAAANGMALFSTGVAATLAAWTWRERRWRWVAAAVAGLCALGILFTLTRAAWIASGAGALVALLVVREGRRLLGPALLAGVIGVVGAFALVPGLQADATRRTDDQRPLWDRRNSTAAAFRMIAERPLVGFGWGGFRYRSADYYRQSRDIPLTFVVDLHNVYLANAVDLGLIGAGLWLVAVVTALLGSLLRRGPPELRPWRLGLVALAASYAISAMSTPLGFALPTLLLCTWAGLLWAEPTGGGQGSPKNAATARSAA